MNRSITAISMSRPHFSRSLGSALALGIAASCVLAASRADAMSAPAFVDEFIATCLARYPDVDVATRAAAESWKAGKSEKDEKGDAGLHSTSWTTPAGINVSLTTISSPQRVFWICGLTIRDVDIPQTEDLLRSKLRAVPKEVPVKHRSVDWTAEINGQPISFMTIAGSSDAPNAFALSVSGQTQRGK
ncbi:MAG TPA: hypothetical protein VIL65_03510 [Beijerinckiaceae bacterium]